jgi:uncharacterized protein YebE (UPF0316 family)
VLEILNDAPPVLVAVAIFLMRIVDVSLGTVRTISVVQGRIKLSVVLGFLEVLVWVSAVVGVLQRVSESPIVMFGYALGFAAGNATGILLERKMALGDVIVRCITSPDHPDLTDTFRRWSRGVTTFGGHQSGEPVELYYAICRRRDVAPLIKAVRRLDPGVYYSVDPIRESSLELNPPLPRATGWRSVLKMK